MFQLVAPFEPAGDQPQAIEALTASSAPVSRRVMTSTGLTTASVYCNILQQMEWRTADREPRR